MKSKLMLIGLLISVWGFSQSVPNTNTFKLTDVTAITGGTTLSQAFANSTDSYFDPAYKGNKDRLSNFRNYTVGSCTYPTIGANAYSSANITSTSFIVNPSILANGTCTITERGAVAGTSPNPTTANIKVSNGSGTGSYTIQFTGLTPNTLYYTRPYYIANSTTVYGWDVEITITTDP